MCVQLLQRSGTVHVVFLPTLSFFLKSVCLLHSFSTLQHSIFLQPFFGLCLAFSLLSLRYVFSRFFLSRPLSPPAGVFSPDHFRSLFFTSQHHATMFPDPSQSVPAPIRLTATWQCGLPFSISLSDAALWALD